MAVKPNPPTLVDALEELRKTIREKLPRKLLLVEQPAEERDLTVIEEKPYDREMAAADPRFAYHNHLEPICVVDVDEVTKKDISYGSSWKKRGGVGAYMMLARKWDRLEEVVESRYRYDVFDAIKSTGGGGEDGTVLAEVRDLRRYLLLVEAEMMQRGVVPAPTQEENSQ
jgi:hypothetical protein